MNIVEGVTEIQFDQNLVVAHVGHKPSGGMHRSFTTAWNTNPDLKRQKLVAEC